jgi:hypothetical protein
MIASALTPNPIPYPFECPNCTKCVVDDVLAPCCTGVCDVIASRLHRPLNKCCNCGKNKRNEKTPLLRKNGQVGEGGEGVGGVGVSIMERFKKYTKRKSSKKYSKKYSKKSKKKSSKKSVRKNKL